jgi:hypothetical protein
LENQIEFIKATGGGGMNDETGKKVLEAFETMVENLRKECYAKFADRD